MSRTQTVTVNQARNELLGRLGLPAGSRGESLTASQRQLGDFLDGAPEELRGWADKRQAEADRIFELLTGPDSDLADLVAARQATAPAPGGFPTWAKWLAGLAAVAAVVFGVYQIGKPPTDLPAMTAAEGATAAPAAPGLDEARVAELMGELQSNPDDVAVLFDLGNAYYQADQYQQASEWYQKVIDVNPDDEKGLVALGATSFNLGDLEKAETVWNRAAELYPNNPEVFYDLGFLYMTTQRMDEMKVAWDKVIEIAPESEFAKTVQSHVGSVKPEAMGSAAPAAEAGPQATPEGNG
ncbi:MAG TPA: tetratricopeptide repeat protein [Propionibacterium sp.]|nr:tetratricopeptide repeat protein [Propionibacterium sp.]